MENAKHGKTTVKTPKIHKIQKVAFAKSQSHASSQKTAKTEKITTQKPTNFENEKLRVLKNSEKLPNLRSPKTSPEFPLSTKIEKVKISGSQKSRKLEKSENSRPEKWRQALTENIEKELRNEKKENLRKSKSRLKFSQKSSLRATSN